MILPILLFVAQESADLRATIRFEPLPPPPKSIKAEPLDEPRIYWGSNPPTPPKGMCWMTWADKPWYLIHALGSLERSQRELRELGAE